MTLAEELEGMPVFAQVLAAAVSQLWKDGAESDEVQRALRRFGLEVPLVATPEPSVEVSP